MRIGIVGSEAAKFTPETEALAKKAIRDLLFPSKMNVRTGVWEKELDPECVVVSGGCHLGGIDIWAVEIAREMGLEAVEHPPYSRCWDAYRRRNLKIVDDSDKVVCITLAKLPESYTGMTFPLCYHCKTSDHVKSGGCWTMHQARKAGKIGELIIIP